MGALHVVCVEDSIVDHTQFAPVGQVDIKTGPLRHDLDALDHEATRRLTLNKSMPKIKANIPERRLA